MTDCKDQGRVPLSEIEGLTETYAQGAAATSEGHLVTFGGTWGNLEHAYGPNPQTDLFNDPTGSWPFDNRDLVGGEFSGVLHALDGLTVFDERLPRRSARTVLITQTKPAARSFFGFVSLPTSPGEPFQFLLFGGFTLKRLPELADTWLLTLEKRPSVRPWEGFDELDAAWSLIEPAGASPSGRMGLGLTATHDGAIHLFGGGALDWDKIDQGVQTLLFLAASPRVDIHWVFDINEKTWTNVVSDGRVPKARSFAGFVSGRAARSNSLYLFGGLDEYGQPLSDLWEYRTKSNTWQELSAFLSGNSPQPRFGLGMFCDNQGDLYITGGQGSKQGYSDLYKVPLPRDDVKIPIARYEFLEIYDEDTIVGDDDDFKLHDAPSLTGVISLCKPMGDPVFPCALRVTGKATLWRSMFKCDRNQGCDNITLDSVHLSCDPSTKPEPTFEISNGAVLFITRSNLSNCSSKANGGLAQAYNLAEIVIDESSISGSRSMGSGGGIALYGSTLKVAKTTFTACSSNLGGGGIWSDIFVALPMAAIDSSLWIDSSLFLLCSTLGDGGAVWARRGTLSIESTTFHSNTALGNFGGGAIALSHVNSILVFAVKHSLGQDLVNNMAQAGGGGVLVWAGSSPTVSVLCAPGFEGDGKSCLPCGKGYYKNATSAQICVQCQPGHFSDQEGSESCFSCPVGKYSNSTGATSPRTCIPCPRDSVGGGSWKTDCLCLDGFEQDASGLCVRCDAGKYKSTHGSDACVDCPPGAHWHASVMRLMTAPS